MILPLLLSLTFLSSAFAKTFGPDDFPPIISDFKNIRQDDSNTILVVDSSSTYDKVLTCDVKSHPKSLIYWFVNGEKISNFENFEVSENSLIVKVKKIGDDSGDKTFEDTFVHCEAVNDLGRAKSHVIKVTKDEDAITDVSLLPRFVIEPKVDIVAFKSKAVFKCSADTESRYGYDRPNIEWTKNGNVISEEFGNTLNIDSVDVDDIATYACNASNAHGYVYKMVYLNILAQKPFFVERPNNFQKNSAVDVENTALNKNNGDESVNRTVSIGHDLILRCAALGYPRPSYTWTVDRKKIDFPTDGGSSVVSFEGSTYELLEGSHLKILSVDANSGGEYECSAYNEHGTVQSGGTNVVIISKTTITRGPVDIDVTVGQKEVVLPCDLAHKNHDDLSVEWKKDNKDIVSSRIVVDKLTNALIINYVEFGDTGTYTCVASSPFTGTDTESGTLTVQGIAPYFIDDDSKPKDSIIAEGKDLKLKCDVGGNPQPSIIWSKDSHVIKSDRMIHDGHSSLIISRVDGTDSGVYTCHASNGVPSDIYASANVQVKMSTQVLSEFHKQIKFEAGRNVTLKCEVVYDPSFNKESDTEVVWLKDGVALTLTTDSSLTSNNKFDTNDALKEKWEESSSAHHIINSDSGDQSLSSITILNLTENEIGKYECVIKTPVDTVTITSVVYEPTNVDLAYKITFLLVICLIITILASISYCLVWRWCVKKRRRQAPQHDFEEEIDDDRTESPEDDFYPNKDEKGEKGAFFRLCFSKNKGRGKYGKYGVKDVENGKVIHNKKSDIHYLIQPGEGAASGGDCLDDGKNVDQQQQSSSLLLTNNELNEIVTMNNHEDLIEYDKPPTNMSILKNDWDINNKTKSDECHVKPKGQGRKNSKQSNLEQAGRRVAVPLHWDNEERRSSSGNECDSGCESSFNVDSINSSSTPTNSIKKKNQRPFLSKLRLMTRPDTLLEGAGCGADGFMPKKTDDEIEATDNFRSNSVAGSSSSTNSSDRESSNNDLLSLSHTNNIIPKEISSVSNPRINGSNRFKLDALGFPYECSSNSNDDIAYEDVEMNEGNQTPSTPVLKRGMFEDGSFRGGKYKSKKTTTTIGDLSEAQTTTLVTVDN